MATGFLSQKGEWVIKIGFSICVSLFVLQKAEIAIFVKWSLARMVSGMGPFEKMLFSC